LGQLREPATRPDLIEALRWLEQVVDCDNQGKEVSESLRKALVTEELLPETARRGNE
jgi:hypothetical protein